MKPTSDESEPKRPVRRSRALTIALIILVILVSMFVIPSVLFFGSIIGDAIKERRSRIPFDSNTWKTSLSKPHDSIRLRMVDDLLRSRKLVGMTRTELVAILGEPPLLPSRRDYDMVYWLGPQRGYMGLDSESLGVRLSADQRVTEVRIIND